MQKGIDATGKRSLMDSTNGRLMNHIAFNQQELQAVFKDDGIKNSEIFLSKSKDIRRLIFICAETAAVP